MGQRRGTGQRGFLLMPFREDLNWLREEIVAAGELVDVEVIRADDIFAAGVVIDQVKRQIRSADVVIAVCTGKNANVFYELGVAERHHNPVLVAPDKKDLPFDIQHFRAQFYGRTDQDPKRSDFRQRLSESIKETVGDRVKTLENVAPGGISLMGDLRRPWAHLVAANFGLTRECQVRMESLDGTGKQETPYPIPWRDSPGPNLKVFAGQRAWMNVASVEATDANNRMSSVKFYSTSAADGFMREIPFESTVDCRLQLVSEPPSPPMEWHFCLFIGLDGQIWSFEQCDDELGL